MDDEIVAAISTVPHKVLAEIVKLAQKQGRRGDKGTWKEFLNTDYKKIGNSSSNPTRRTPETLIAFLLSFTEKEDLEFLDNVLRLHFNHEMLKQLMNESSDRESPPQRLVRLTTDHLYYRSKYAFPSFDKNWVVTKLPKKSKLLKSSQIIAIDCETVLCEDGTDALVRVCVVDHNLQVILDEKVNPVKPVADYRTEITGITAADLDEVSYSLADIQQYMKNLLKDGTILVGHGLHNDLLALKLVHAKVIDTSFIFSRFDGRPPSLSTLCKFVLGYELRKGEPHDCVDDASAAMKLVLAVEHGLDNDLLLIQEEVPENGAKLLIHGIPIEIPREKLFGFFTEKCTLKIKAPKKAEGKQYSAHAIFSNPQEAERAFENLKGKPKRDKYGFQQKTIKLWLKPGSRRASIHVRRMGHDSLVNLVSQSKRALESEDLPEQKKVKTEEGGDHSKEKEDNQLEEIERLKEDLSAWDCQISAQDELK